MCADGPASHTTTSEYSGNKVQADFAENGRNTLGSARNRRDRFEHAASLAADTGAEILGAEGDSSIMKLMLIAVLALGAASCATPVNDLGNGVGGSSGAGASSGCSQFPDCSSCGSCVAGCMCSGSTYGECANVCGISSSGGSSGNGGNAGSGGFGNSSGFGGFGNSSGSGGFGSGGFGSTSAGGSGGSGTGGFGSTSAGGSGGFGGGTTCSVTVGDPICDACVHAQCCTEAEACVNNPDCTGLMACLGLSTACQSATTMTQLLACADTACPAQIAGKASFSAYVTCMSTQCAGSCGI
ncbi:MAG TPA: hypothetical protein PKA88_16090 [Polyangiaceae bacterium]|nr:hypothetical protein [Polyangiaceae bacterium]